MNSKLSKLLVAVLFLAVILISCKSTDEGKKGGLMRAFPQNLSGTAEHVSLPSGELDEINAAVKHYYQLWKYGEERMDNFTNEVREFPGYLREMETIEKAYYVKMVGQGDAGTPPQKSTAEAMGYGMLISVLMDDGTVDAKGRTGKEIFDGLYKTVMAFPSQTADGKVLNKYLMSWTIPVSEKQADARWSSTDGDLDIAYALLLADKQWGSKGKVNYKEEAIRRIDAMAEFNIDRRDVEDKGYPRLNTGNWYDEEVTSLEKLLNSCRPNHTRPCDWMLSHTIAFYRVTGDEVWKEVTEGIYKMTADLRENYAPETGLVPDFVYNEPGTPVRPTNKETEGPLEETPVDSYAYNATRFPWRHAMGYTHFKDERAKENVMKILDWFISQGVDSPDKVISGYSLDGKPLVNYGGDNVFTAPLMVAATVDPKYRSMVDTFWATCSTTFVSDYPDWLWWGSGESKEKYYSDMKKDQFSGYFGDSINMLCLLAVSGNWWIPYEGEYGE